MNNKLKNHSLLPEFLVSNQQVGVIGYGRFGKLMCDQLFSGTSVSLYSPHMTSETAPANVTFQKSLEQLSKSSDIIIPAVPISEFENVITQIAPYLRDGATVIDVCSVKVYPVEVMKEKLSPKINIIATHPMFGTATFEKRGRKLHGLPMVMCDVWSNEDVYEGVQKHFKTLGLGIIEMDPDEHDRLAAQSHFFTQMVRYIALNLDLDPTIIDTPAASSLFESLSYMGTDKRLLHDLIKYNSYCQKILYSSIQTLINLRKSALGD